MAAATKKDRLDPFEVVVNMQIVSFTRASQMNICNYQHRTFRNMQSFGKEWKGNDFTLSPKSFFKKSELCLLDIKLVDCFLS